MGMASLGLIILVASPASSGVITYVPLTGRRAMSVLKLVFSEDTFLISSNERWSKCSWLIRRTSALSGIGRILKGSMMMVLPFLILKESWPSQLILTP